MFWELRSRFDEALRQTLGVDIDTAQEIVAQHGNEAVINAWRWGPFGQMDIVNSETLPERVHQYVAQGATSVSVTVFDEKMTRGDDGAQVPHTRMAARYSIWVNN